MDSDEWSFTHSDDKEGTVRTKQLIETDLTLLTTSIRSEESDKAIHYYKEDWRMFTTDQAELHYKLTHRKGSLLSQVTMLLLVSVLLTVSPAVSAPVSTDGAVVTTLEPWHQPCGPATGTQKEAAILPPTVAPITREDLLEEYRRLIKLLEEADRHIEDLMENYHMTQLHSDDIEHYNLNNRTLQNISQHGMPEVKKVTEEYKKHLHKGVLGDIFDRFANVSVFLEQIRLDESDEQFKKEIKGIEQKIGFVLCKVQLIMAHHNMEINMYSRRFIFGDGLKKENIKGWNEWKRLARDFLILRDTRALLTELTVQEIQALIGQL